MSFSRVNRRIHMYLGLFFAPWMLMYALAGLAGNHRDSFGDVEYVFERDIPYERVFSDEVSNEARAKAILRDIDLGGIHAIRDLGNGRMAIYRENPIWSRRITYEPGEKKLAVEIREFQLAACLMHLHHTHGYSGKNLIYDIWVFFTDVAIFAILFWSLSGLWIWWKLRRTRRVGAVCAISGATLFVFIILAV